MPGTWGYYVTIHQYLNGCTMIYKVKPFNILLLVAGAVMCLALVSCTSDQSGSNVPLEATQSYETAAQSVDQPDEKVITCPFCGSNDVEKRRITYKNETAEPQTCPFDQFTFKSDVVIAQTDCTCQQCHKIWIQQERYALSSCPAHGELTQKYESTALRIDDSDS